MSSSETSRPSALKKPSSTAASAGKYEFEIISGTAIFMGSSFFRHRGGQRKGRVFYFFPSSSQPNFSFAFFATSGLGVLLGGNFSRQCHGLQALISATECVKSPAARRSGGIAGSALESHEPVMNWIDSLGSVRVSIAHSMWSRLVTSTSSSHTTMYFEA